FPTTDRILSTAKAMREFVEFADKARLFPKLYWLSGSKTDPFGQRTLDFVDSKGEILPIYTPQTVEGTLISRGLSQARPVLIAPGNIFGLPNADLIFEVRQESVYSTYWHGYPARGEHTILPTPEPELTTPIIEPSFDS